MTGDTNNDDKTTDAVVTETVEELRGKVEHWRQMSRKNEERASANSAAAKRAEEAESKLAEAVARADAAEAGSAAKAADVLRDALVSLGVVSEEDKVLLTGSDSETLLAQVARLTERGGKKDGGNRAPLAGHTSSKGAEDPLSAVTRSLFGDRR